MKAKTIDLPVIYIYILMIYSHVLLHRYCMTCISSSQTCIFRINTQIWFRAENEPET